MLMMNNEIVLGIDLGTSNSVACVYIDGNPTFIKSSEGVSIYGNSFPSYVRFTEDEIIAGEPAKRKLVTDSQNVVRAIKKEMGTDKKRKFFGKLYSPQEISSHILSKIKKDAEAQLGKPIHKAIITVPAYFNDNQRTATKDAGRIAGLEVDQLINEPTAACLAYGIDNKSRGIQNILVFDLGAGTLDVTIMKYGGVLFEVLATKGRENGGGNDMDSAIVAYLRDEFRKQHGFSLPETKRIDNRLFIAAERAKIDLSSVVQTEIDLDNMAMDSDGNPIDFITTLNRSKLEYLVREIVNQCGSTIQKALDDAKLSKGAIDQLVLVGGPTKMPIVREYVENFMGKKAVSGFDPMYCVSQGAAIKAGIETGEIEGMEVRDVTPLSLGVIIKGGITDVIIKRNSRIPVIKTRKFWTIRDNQTIIRVEVVQGEFKMAKENAYLGSFTLNVDPAPKNKTIVEITFTIDNDGILSVNARDVKTGNQKSVSFESPNQMSESEIQEALRKVDENGKKDLAEMKIAELKNEADNVIYDANRLINSSNLSYGDKSSLEKLVGDLECSVYDENKLKIQLNIKKIKDIIFKSR